jgi:methylenetetrahydrofolate dehydrogenase (NADP+)/methenyltetrahydrofolate cyclohydrolase
MTTVVDGNALAREIRTEISASFANLVSQGHPPPRVAIVQVGDDKSASMYTRRLQKSFTDNRVEVEVRQLAGDIDAAAAVQAVADLSRDSAIHGIQIQTPVPAEISLARLLEALDPTKDLDGIHPANAGLLAQGRPAVVPATPLGGLEILLRHQIEISGARAVVVGRSTPVGRPMALLLIQNDATVTVCHSRTRAMGDVTREADILAVAAGRAGLVTREMVRPGAAVIDFGVNVIEGKAVGDVAPDVAEIAGLFTPVPGGTGPLTTAMLLKNTLQLYSTAIGATSS